MSNQIVFSSPDRDKPITNIKYPTNYYGVCRFKTGTNIYTGFFAENVAEKAEKDVRKFGSHNDWQLEFMGADRPTIYVISGKLVGKQIADMVEAYNGWMNAVTLLSSREICEFAYTNVILTGLPISLTIMSNNTLIASFQMQFIVTDKVVSGIDAEIDNDEDEFWRKVQETGDYYKLLEGASVTMAIARQTATITPLQRQALNYVYVKGYSFTMTARMSAYNADNITVQGSNAHELSLTLETPRAITIEEGGRQSVIQTAYELEALFNDVLIGTQQNRGVSHYKSHNIPTISINQLCFTGVLFTLLNSQQAAGVNTRKYNTVGIFENVSRGN